MKIALAQIDMRLGDIEGICSRLESQALLAADSGAQLLCAPAPLFAGVLPGSLVDYGNYEHDLLRSLTSLASDLADTGVVCLLPAIVPFDGGALFEVFMLREGRVVPTRLTLAQFRGDEDGAWMPPVFDVAGTRVAVTFDAARDLGELPTGCDLVVFFQVNGFCTADEATAAVAAVGDGYFGDEVRRAGVWLAHVAPVGGFEEAAYTGGSFVMDDSGRIVAAAPCFAEAQLVQDVERGCTLPALGARELPAFNREEWLWEALRLHLRDTLADAGYGRAVVPLEGDLPSSLLAVLAVDALGSRNVFGLVVEGPDPMTPAGEARCAERMSIAREVAANLHIRLVERSVGEAAALLSRDAPMEGATARRRLGRLYRELAGVSLADAARVQRAAALSPLTKTDAALRADVLRGGRALLAPFGDVYLTKLEDLARMRERASAVLPARLLGLRAVKEVLAEVVADAAELCCDSPADRVRVHTVLGALEPSAVDLALEAHVDLNQPFENILLADHAPEATAVLLMLVRRGEAARRSLPVSPSVSACSFAERAWPAGLAWSDLGRHGEEPLRAVDFAKAERGRIESRGDERGIAARSEILGLLGGLLGLTPEQMTALGSEDGQRRMREDIQRFEEHLQDAFGRMAGRQGAGPDADSGRQGPAGPFPPSMGPGSFPFFSQN